MPRPPTWKLYELPQSCGDLNDVGQFDLSGRPSCFNWPLQLPGIDTQDPVQVMADVFNEKPLIVNMMTSYGPERTPLQSSIPSPEYAHEPTQAPVDPAEKTKSEEDNDDVPVDSGYPSTGNTAPASSHSLSVYDVDTSSEVRDDLNWPLFTDPFAPQPGRRARQLSPPISPNSNDPLRKFPANEAQAVNSEGVPPPRIEDHPSLNSGEGLKDPSAAPSGVADTDAAVQSG